MSSVTNHFRHVIVGGGVTGASIAYHLAKGLVAAPQTQNTDESSICVLDRATIGSGQTSRSAGIVLHEHKIPIAIALANQTSDDIFRDLAVHTDDIILEQPGSFNATTGVLNTQDFFVDPQSLVTSYLRRAKSLVTESLFPPVCIQENIEVQEIVVNIEDEGNAALRLQTSSGVITADCVYLAAGVWSDYFLDDTYWANLRSHYWEFAWSDSEYLDSKLKDVAMPMYFAPGIYMKISRNRRTVEIGIQEEQSLVVPKPPKHNSDGLGNGTDDDGLFGPTELLLAKQSIIEEQLGQNFLEIADMRAYISGLSTYTADGLPVIHSTITPHTKELSPRGMVACGGCNGYGITWAGGLGKIIASIGLDHTDTISKEKKVEADVLAALNARRFEGYSGEHVTELAVAQRHNKFMEKHPDE